MITATPNEDSFRRIREGISAALLDIKVELRVGLEAFGEETVRVIREQPPYGHPPGGPHPGAGEQPVFGRHAYIDRTGYLTNSITSHRLGDTRLQVMASAPYAEDVEYGTPRSRPYPFFWPVVHDRTPQFEPFLAQGVVKVLEELARGLA